MIIEICANSFESAVAAQKAGADRIELCTELSVGGLTPSYGLIKKTMEELSIPVHVLIRPRSANFTYSDHEIEIMKKNILLCKNLGCAGIVSGILQKNNDIDLIQTKQLIELAAPMEFTFHRAFDWVNHPLQEMKNLIDLGVTRILSSGQKNKAIDGIDLLQKLKNNSEEKIQIMPGGGIHKNNILSFKNIGFRMVHFSATDKIQTLPNFSKVKMHSNLFFNEGILATSNYNIIKEIIEIIK